MSIYIYTCIHINILFLGLCPPFLDSALFLTQKLSGLHQLLLGVGLRLSTRETLDFRHQIWRFPETSIKKNRFNQSYDFAFVDVCWFHHHVGDPSYIPIGVLSFLPSCLLLQSPLSRVTPNAPATRV